MKATSPIGIPVMQSLRICHGMRLRTCRRVMQQASASGFVPGENTMILPVTVNGLDGQLFLEDDWENKRNVITWIDPDSNLQFTLHANLDRTDILDMAESVSLVKTEK